MDWDPVGSSLVQPLVQWIPAKSNFLFGSFPASKSDKPHRVSDSFPTVAKPGYCESSQSAFVVDVFSSPSLPRQFHVNRTTPADLSLFGASKASGGSFFNQREGAANSSLALPRISTLGSYCSKAKNSLLSGLHLGNVWTPENGNPGVRSCKPADPGSASLFVKGPPLLCDLKPKRKPKGKPLRHFGGSDS